MRPILAVPMAVLLLAGCSDDDDKNGDDGTCVNCVCVNCTADGDGDAPPTDDEPGPVLLTEAPFYKTQSQQNIYLSGVGLCVSSADVDNDGNLDLVAGSTLQVAVMKGGPNGIMSAANAPSGSTFGVQAVAFARLDANASLDLLAARADGSATEIYLNTGNPSTPYTTATLTDPFLAMLTTDIDGDGDIDVIGTTQHNTVAIVRNNGSGALEGLPAGSQYAAGNDPKAMVGGDLDADGHLDIVTVNQSASSISILMGTGGALDAAFEPTVYLSTHDGPRSAAIADFTGDGHPDIVVVHEEAGYISVYPGNGNGTFGAVIDTVTGGGHRAASVTSFNGDARPDLYVAGVAGVNPAYLAGRGDGTFLVARRHPTSNAFDFYEGNALTAPDLDKNGLPDFASTFLQGPSGVVGVSLLVNPPN